jgi:hypothetical protein
MISPKHIRRHKTRQHNGITVKTEVRLKQHQLLQMTAACLLTSL